MRASNPQSARRDVARLCTERIQRDRIMSRSLVLSRTRSNVREDLTFSGTDSKRGLSPIVDSGDASRQRSPRAPFCCWCRFERVASTRDRNAGQPATQELLARLVPYRRERA